VFAATPTSYNIGSDVSILWYWLASGYACDSTMTLPSASPPVWRNSFQSGASYAPYQDLCEDPATNFDAFLSRPATGWNAFTGNQFLYSVWARTLDDNSDLTWEISKSRATHGEYYCDSFTAVTPEPCAICTFAHDVDVCTCVPN